MPSAARIEPGAPLQRAMPPRQCRHSFISGCSLASSRRVFVETDDRETARMAAVRKTSGIGRLVNSPAHATHCCPLHRAVCHALAHLGTCACRINDERADRPPACRVALAGHEPTIWTTRKSLCSMRSTITRARPWRSSSQLYIPSHPGCRSRPADGARPRPLTLPSKGRSGLLACAPDPPPRQASASDARPPYRHLGRPRHLGLARLRGLSLHPAGPR